MEFQRIRLDNFKRKLHLRYELLTRLLKCVANSNQIPFAYKYVCLRMKIRIPRTGGQIRFTNQCVRTSRARAVTKYTRYSRFKLRSELYNGNLPGFSRIT